MLQQDGSVRHEIRIPPPKNHQKQDDEIVVGVKSIRQQQKLSDLATNEIVGSSSSNRLLQVPVPFPANGLPRVVSPLDLRRQQQLVGSVPGTTLLTPPHVTTTTPTYAKGRYQTATQGFGEMFFSLTFLARIYSFLCKARSYWNLFLSVIGTVRNIL